MKMLPAARDENLVMQNLKDEILIYDLKTNKAYCLNETSKIVYHACCDGLDIEDLKRRHKFADDLIYYALDELKKNNLLADEDYVSPFAGMNRREVIKKVGFASVVALPIISAMVAPTAASAASPVACPNPPRTITVQSSFAACATFCQSICSPCFARGVQYGRDGSCSCNPGCNG